MTACCFEPKYLRKYILQSCTPLEAMKRVKSNYHALHVLKRVEPRLRKALISNSNKEQVNCIGECVLYVLNGNIRLSGCKTSKLKTHKSTLHKVANRHVPISTKKRLILQFGVFLLPLLNGILPTIASLIFNPG